MSGNLPSDFGFAIDVHAHEPETIYVVPIKSDSEHYPPDGKLRVYRSRSGGDEWEALTKGLPQRDCYVNVLRDAMAVDSLDKCGVYFGTTGGQVYGSADAGDNWTPIVRDLPPVVSVEAQTLLMIRVVLPAHLRTLARVDGEVTVRVEREVTQRARARRARGHVSSAAWNDSGPRHAEAPLVRQVFRLRAGSVPRTSGHAASRRRRDGTRAVPGRRGDGWRIGATDNTEDTELRQLLRLSGLHPEAAQQSTSTTAEQPPRSGATAAVWSAIWVLSGRRF